MTTSGWGIKQRVMGMMEKRNKNKRPFLYCRVQDPSGRNKVQSKLNWKFGCIIFLKNALSHREPSLIAICSSQTQMQSSWCYNDAENAEREVYFNEPIAQSACFQMRRLAYARLRPIAARHSSIIVTDHPRFYPVCVSPAFLSLPNQAGYWLYSHHSTPKKKTPFISLLCRMWFIINLQ